MNAYVPVNVGDSVFVVVAETTDDGGPFGTLGLRVCDVAEKIGASGKIRIPAGPGDSVTAWLETDGTVTPDVSDPGVLPTWPLTWHAGQNLAEASKRELEAGGPVSFLRMMPRATAEEAKAMIRSSMTKEVDGSRGFSFAVSSAVARSFRILDYLDFVDVEDDPGCVRGFHMVGPVVVTRTERGYKDGPDRIVRREMRYGRLSPSDMAAVVEYARERYSELK